MNFEIGDSVTIAAGKHKGKSATVMEKTSSEICCYVDKEFYFWFQPEDLSKPMTQIKFPQTEAIASQIAQLQEQLKKYQDCETNANLLKEQVAQQAQLMIELEVEQSAIVDWANRLYFLATGIDLRKEEGRRQEVEDTAEIPSVFPDEEAPIENKFNHGDTVKTDLGDIGEVTGFAYGNVVVKLPNGEFQFSDRLLTKVESMTDLLIDDIVKHEDGKVGTITYIPNPFKGIVSVKMPDGNFNYHADKLVLVSRPNPKLNTKTDDAQIQSKATDFISNIKTKSAASEVTWATIKELCQKDIKVLREIGLAARIKVQKELVESIPSLLAEYIKSSGDRSDLDWVGNTIKQKTEELLSLAEEAIAS